MEMRLARISGVAEMSEHVAGMDRITLLYLDSAGTQMRVGGVVAVAEIFDDVIAGERI